MSGTGYILNELPDARLNFTLLLSGTLLILVSPRQNRKDFTLCIAFVFLHTKYTGQRQNDCTVHA